MAQFNLNRKDIQLVLIGYSDIGCKSIETLPYQVVNGHGPNPPSTLQLPCLPRPLSLVS